MDPRKNTIKAVRVWLDTSDNCIGGVLLGTLRPETSEQLALSLTLLACDEDGGEEISNRRLRVETIAADCQTDYDKVEKMLNCSVHITGKIEPLPYSPDDDAEEGETESESDMEYGCSGGCPL